MLKLVLFVVPLGFDTFAVSTAIGLLGGVSKRERLRLSLLFSAFEMAMPLLGLLAGRSLGAAIGEVADYLAVALLAAVGLWMLFERENEERLESLRDGHALGRLALGVSISLDELAMGFAIGLLRLSLWAAIALIGAQAFLVAQLGLRLGARLGERVREGAERFAGIALLGLAIFFLTERLT